MDFLNSQEINGYTFVERLGRGGMGSVYRAFHETMKRDVAIKVLAIDLADKPQYIARFNREAETLVQLEHPHIVPIYDYDTFQNFTYIVMRLLTGGSLEEKLKSSQLLTIDQIAHTFRQVTAALHYAHQRGVIHRDIKSSNVMIDDAGNAYLTDFGIAKLVFETAQFTTTGSTLGTPMYMAPELWKGADSSIKTDIYALGIVLYQMLTNTLPFTTPTPFALMDKHLHEMPKPVSTFRDDITEAMDAVIWQALAKFPEERYVDVESFAQQFENALPTQNYPVKHRVVAHSKNSANLKPISAEDQLLTQPEHVNLESNASDITPILTNNKNSATNESSPKRFILKLIVILLLAVIIGAGLIFGIGAREDASDNTKQVAQTTPSPTPNSPTPTRDIPATDTPIPTVGAVGNEIEPVAIGILYGQANAIPQTIYADELVHPTGDSVLVFKLEDKISSEILLQANSQVIFHYDETIPQINIEFVDDSFIFFSSPGVGVKPVQFAYLYHAQDTFLPLSFGDACSATEYLVAGNTLTLTTYCLSSDASCPTNDDLSLEFGEFLSWDLTAERFEPTSGTLPEIVENILALYKDFNPNYELPACLLPYAESTATDTPVADIVEVTPSAQPSSTPTPPPPVPPTSIPPTNTPVPPLPTEIPPLPTICITSVISGNCS